MLDKVKNLQEEFALVDLMTKKGKSGLLEVLLKKLLPLEFRMEPDHHGAPHVHISYGKDKHTASYRINDAVRVAGNLDNKYDKVVRQWITKNQVLLRQIWDEMKAGNLNKYELLIDQLL